MDFRDTLTALLPPPRDDEPASLRHDILDELGDHLACAYNRELLRGADSSVGPAACSGTVRRSGGRGAPALVRCDEGEDHGSACIDRDLSRGDAGLWRVGWSGLELDESGSAAAGAAQAAEAIEANRRMAEALAQAQATNKDMLKKLGEMSEAIRHPRLTRLEPGEIRGHATHTRRPTGGGMPGHDISE